MGLWVDLSNRTSFTTSPTPWAQWGTNAQMKVLAGDFNNDGTTDAMKVDGAGCRHVK
jgi:hypothetical protein